MPPNTAKNPYENSIFWIDVEKIVPNPYQPRREFDEQALRDLSDSIRQYGILQPLVVSRIENWNEDGSLQVTYELIAGERRLRASKLAHLSQVPVIVRVGDDNRTKLELAILENLQREDLNPVDRAKAFARLATEFNLKHQEIGQKVSKSREYVSNTLRLLMLPEDILNALAGGKISEGHTRPLMMLADRPEEQLTLFKEMLIRKMTVREAENIARRIAYDKARKKDRFFDPDIAEIEGSLAETLGTRVQIEKREVGGKISIDFFSFEELQAIMEHIRTGKPMGNSGMRDVIARVDPKAIMQASAPVASVAAVVAAVAIPVIAEVVQEERVEASNVVLAPNTIAELQTEQLPIIATDIHPAASAPHELMIPTHTEVATYVEEYPVIKTDMFPVVQESEALDSIVAMDVSTTDRFQEPLSAEVTFVTESNLVDDRSKDDVRASENTDDTDLYNLNTFSV